MISSDLRNRQDFGIIHKKNEYYVSKLIDAACDDECINNSTLQESNFKSRLMIREPKGDKRTFFQIKFEHDR